MTIVKVASELIVVMIVWIFLISIASASPDTGPSLRTQAATLGSSKAVESTSTGGYESQILSPIHNTPFEIVGLEQPAADPQGGSERFLEITIRTGDTLDALLSKVNIDEKLRADVSFAFAAEYDLRRLQPGDRLKVIYASDRTPKVVMLIVGDGVRIEVSLGKSLDTRTVLPPSISIERAAQLVIDGSIYDSLNKANAPARFALDLSLVLNDTIDFRRDLRGGETLRVLWAQSEREDGSMVGQPEMDYASIDLVGDLFEIIWVDEDRDHTSLYVNGDLQRMIPLPVAGAYLSSGFGRREHPIYESVRTHTGVDFAAEKGAPVTATASGEVTFIGRLRGYGRVVEISHHSDTLTRYAHLSAVPKSLVIGSAVTAGDMIGRVGETGTATSPNLHYEVRVNDHPINPLGDLQFDSIGNSHSDNAQARLTDARLRFASTLTETERNPLALIESQTGTFLPQASGKPRGAAVEQIEDRLAIDTLALDRG